MITMPGEGFRLARQLRRIITYQRERQKALCGFTVRKVATPEFFQVLPFALNASTQFAAAIESDQVDSGVTKPSIAQNQRPIAKFGQGAAMRGDNNQRPIVSGVGNQ